MEYRCGKPAINAGLLEQIGKMPIVPSAARSNHGDRDRIAHEAELIEIIPSFDPVIVHAIQDDFSSTALLRLTRPGDSVTG